MILVIGGAGYIGAHMVKLLRRRGEPVLVFDNLSRGHRAALAGAALVEGDLRRRGDLERVFGGRAIECVMHFAALASVGESMRAPELYYDNNVVGCFNLLEAMRAHGVERLVFSSSAATYGEPQAVPIGEDHPQRPTNPYGETKLVMERMLRWYGEAHGLRSVVLRYFNAAGADPDGELGEDHAPEEHLIPLVLGAVLGKRREVEVYGTDWPTPDGTCVRDYVHVVDLCRAHALALDRLRRGEPSAIYNLGGGSGWSVRQVIAAAGQVVGSDIPWRPAPRRPGDPARLVASCDRAERELGWRAERGALETILRDAWEWHRRHPGGYA
jgi:UDP-glucose 4-epimerase